MASRGIFQTNPYEGNPALSELEAEVLWEYAKLSQNLKEVRLRPSVRVPTCACPDCHTPGPSQLTAQTRRLRDAPEKTLHTTRQLLIKTDFNY